MATKIKASDLRKGDRVDLEGDEFADPDGDNPSAEFEFQVVEKVERETDETVAVYFQDYDAIGFPVDHEVAVERRGPEVKRDGSWYAYLTDRHGDLNVHGADFVGDEEAVERLVDKMYDEATFVVRRKSDGVRGILVEANERGFQGGLDDPSDFPGGLPTLDEAIEDLTDWACDALERFPEADVWVEVGPDVCMSRGVVRCFVPEGSPLMDQVPSIAHQLMGVPDPAPSP